MKTIKISIDEHTLASLDRVARRAEAASRAGSGLRKRQGLTRSQVVRMALREFLARQERTQRDERDRCAFAKNRDAIARQAAALVLGQARQ